MRQGIIGLLFLLGLLVGAVTPSHAMGSVASAESMISRAPIRTTLARLEPSIATYFGVNLQWGEDTATAYTQRLGHAPMIYVNFFRFPFESSDLQHLETFISQVAAQQGMAMLTLEPVQGLAAITPAVAEDLAIRLAAYNAAGVPTFVRFAHEMNGSWYPWSQQPAAYTQRFRLLAEAVHRHAAQSAMVWAPNYGAGYPFHGGAYEAHAGSPDFAALDTNGDGTLSMADDMYQPYYPGDDAVDWVGMSLYHWGNTYPWGENEIPEANKFLQQVQGTYAGLNGDEQAVPNFYADYVLGHDKPMAIPETAALYNPTHGGASAQMLKRAWWQQVFSEEVAQAFPRIKMINWFEWRKAEAEIGGDVIDWSATLDPQIASLFQADLPYARLIFAPAASAPGFIYVPLVAR